MLVRFSAGLSCAVFLLLAGCGDSEQTGEEFWDVELEGLDPALLAVQPLPGGDLLAVGGPLVRSGPPSMYRRTNDAWSELSPPAGWQGAIWWSWASDSDVWVVGDLGQVSRGPLDGLSPMQTGTSTGTVFYGVWGASDDDVWIVGGSVGKGVILHWDGSALSPVTPTGTASVALESTLFKVWGSSSEHVMIVGAFGVAILWDGQKWIRTETGTGQQLTTVHGTGPNDIYAVGGFTQGLVLRYDGSAWTEIGERFAPPISGVFATPERVWVAGDAGYLSYYAGGEWTTVDTLLLSQFHAVHAGPSGTFGVGGILSVSAEPRNGFVGRFGP